MAHALGDQASTAEPSSGRQRVFISDDMNSVALGADTVADAFATAGSDVVRVSSRGLWSIEPLVEIETPEGRIGYGPVGPEDVAAVLDGSHANRLGDVGALPFFVNQQRFTFARAGITQPLSLEEYEAHGGWAGLRKARGMAPADVVAQVKASGLRGRGGAGFPTGIKWQTVLDARGPEKFIVCNADEGDSGTFADRMVMEGDPFMLIEGMAIAAHAVGASYGYIYCRSEYPFAIRKLEEAIRRSAGIVAPVRAGSAHGRRRLCLRRRDRLARLDRGQARPGPRQAAAARTYRPVRQAHRHQQRAFPRRRAVHLGGGGRDICRGRFRPLARYDAGAACRLHQAWRALRGRLRHHAGRAGERDRRRHRLRAGR